MAPIPLNEPLNGPASTCRRARTLRTALTVAAAFAVAVPTAFFAVTGLDTNYEAVGALWIAEAPERGRTGEVGTQGAEALPGQAWAELLRSYVVLDAVAVERLARGPSGDAGPQEVRATAQDLSSRLEAAMDREGNFLRVTFHDPDPEEAASVLHAIMKRHVEVAAELKARRLAETVGVLEAQLDEMDGRLAAAERELEGFLVGTIRGPDGTLVTPPEWKAHEGRLRRRMRSHENVYNEIRSRVERARLAQASAVPDVRVLDVPVVPARRPGPADLLLAMVVFLATMGVVLLGARLAERLGVFEAGAPDRF